MFPPGRLHVTQKKKKVAFSEKPLNRIILTSKIVPRTIANPSPPPLQKNPTNRQMDGASAIASKIWCQIWRYSLCLNDRSRSTTTKRSSASLVWSLIPHWCETLSLAISDNTDWRCLRTGECRKPRHSLYHTGYLLLLLLLLSSFMALFSAWNVAVSIPDRVTGRGFDSQCVHWNFSVT
jgi:hypothetical protein